MFFIWFSEFVDEFYTMHDLRFGTDKIGMDEIWTICLGSPNFIILNFIRTKRKI